MTNTTSKKASAESLTAPNGNEISSPMTTLNNPAARRKMIFLALLSGAMIYRQDYINDEVEAHRVMCEEMGNSMINDPEKKVKTAGQKKKVTQRAAAIHYLFRNKVQKFDKVCTEEITAVSQEFNILDKEAFKSYAEGFGSIIEQYLNAKDTGDLISVCQAYNAGLLDEVILAMRVEQVEQKEEFLNRVESIGNLPLPE